MRLKLFVMIAWCALVSVCAAQTRSPAAAPPPAAPSYIVTSDDASAIYGDNTISYFEAGGSPSAPSLTYQNTVTDRR